MPPSSSSTTFRIKHSQLIVRYRATKVIITRRDLGEIKEFLTNIKEGTNSSLVVDAATYSLTNLLMYNNNKLALQYEIYYANGVYIELGFKHIDYDSLDNAIEKINRLCDK